MASISTKKSLDLHKNEECKKENEQNIQIIAKQKLLIKTLEESITYLSSENEKLLKRNEKLESLLRQSTQEPSSQNSSHTVPHTTSELPAPPPKSPYRMQNKTFEKEGRAKKTFQSGKRPPELKLVSSNKNTGKKNFTPQPSNSPVSSGLEDGLSSGSRPCFSLHDPQYQNEISSKEERNSQETKSSPTTPVLPRTPRYDSLVHTHNSKSLTSLKVDIISSTIHIDEKGKEIPLFTIGIHQQGSGAKNRLWNIEKNLHEIQSLDKSLKEDNPTFAHLLKKLPEKSLIVSRAPAKVDGRKRSIEEYLQHAVSLNLPNTTSLREFLNPELFTGPSKQTLNKYSVKEGYLTKKRKKIGGWLLRYYVLFSNGLFTYFENKDGNLLGTINLNNSQILNYTVSEQQYRHAFVLIEHKATNQVQKHILCADSDDERDLWVAHLRRATQQEANSQSEDNTSYSETNKTLKKRKSLESSSITTHSSGNSLNSFSSNEIPSPRTSVSDQTGFSLEEHSNSNSSKKLSHRRTPWNKKTSSIDESQDRESNINEKSHQVFGIPLTEAIENSKVSDQYVLPSIVFRCIEYLESKGALEEEGIYRLSGSALDINNLKNRFNTEGDIDLLKEDDTRDVHAIAGLLKMWLRELPENIFTQDLLKEYIDSSKATEQAKKEEELGDLVSLLPLANYTLLRFLCGHLVRVIQNASKNKMTLNNICVVFSATLGIPSIILQMMLTKFNVIFWTEGSYPENDQDSDDEEFSAENTLNIYMQDIESHEYLLDEFIKNKTRPPLFNKNLGQSTTSLRSARNSIYYRYNTPVHFVSLEQKLKEIDTDSFLYDDDSYYFNEGDFEKAHLASRKNANIKQL